MINKVGIYLRLSDEDNNKIDISESIKNQRNLLLNEIKKHSDFELVHEYCDENLSGAGTYRPEFERLIKDCELGKIDIVMCKSQSRFSRDMEIIEKYIHNKFIEWNIRFIGVADNADTNFPGNKKARQINGLVNEWYLEDTSNNIKSAFKAKMINGEFISPFAAYGYSISKENNNKLVIDYEAAKVVKDIFKMYLNGFGYTTIVKKLNESNIPCPSLYKFQKGIKLNITSKKKREDIKWNINAIKTILTNEIYIGNLVQGKRTTVSYKNHKTIKKNETNWIKKENTHEPIIDKQTFFKVQENIKKKNRIIKSTGLMHPFSNKVFCSECNYIMRKKNSQKYEYLVCSNNNCNNKKGIRYDLLEKIILNKINKIIEKYYKKDILTELINKKYTYNKNKLIIENKNKLILKVEKQKNYLKNLYEDKVNNIISCEQFMFLLKYYNEEINKYNISIKKLDKELKSLNKTDNIIKSTYKIEKLNKLVINEFIKKIYIDKIKNNIRNIKIEWIYLLIFVFSLFIQLL